jgi:hypothetical protein
MDTKGGSSANRSTLANTSAKSLPVRSYLDQTVVPILLDGLTELARIKYCFLCFKLVELTSSLSGLMIQWRGLAIIFSPTTQILPNEKSIDVSKINKIELFYQSHKATEMSGDGKSEEAHVVPINDHEMDDLVSILKGSLSEDNRLKRLKASVNNFWFSCDQVKQIVGNKHFAWNTGAGPVQAAIVLYPR